MVNKKKYFSISEFKEGSWPLLFTILFILSFLSVDCQAQNNKKIISINLCTDQYLLALADKKNILALSPFAKDLGMSYLAQEANEFQTIRDDAESVLQLKPDIVVASSFNNPNTLKLLRSNGIKVVTIGFASKLEDIKTHIDQFADGIGYQSKAVELKKQFEQTLQETKDLYKKYDLTILYYQRGGFIAGKGSLFGMIIEHAGLKNLAALQNRPTFGSMSIETLIVNPPDILVLSKSIKAYHDQGRKLLKHPAMLKSFSDHKILRFPTSETVCSGPGTIAALKRLKEIKKLF